MTLIEQISSAETLRRTFLTEDYDFEAIRKVYSKDGDIGDFVELLDDPKVRSDVLYGLAEIGESARPVWKKALPYVSSPNTSESIWALNTVLAFATDADCPEILYCLTHINWDEGALFEGIFDLLLTRIIKYEAICDKLLTLVLDSTLSPVHGIGLFLLANPKHPGKECLEKLLQKNKHELNLYVYVYIAVNCRNDEQLTLLLPERIKKGMVIAYM